MTIVQTCARADWVSTGRRIRLCLNSNFFSAYLCVPLRLRGKQVVRAHLPQRRRGTQRYAEKTRHHVESHSVLLVQSRGV